MRVTLLGLALLFFPEQDSGQKWKVSIESLQKVCRPGGRVFLKFTVENPTDQPMDLAEPVDYAAGLRIVGPGNKVIREFEKTKDIKRVVKADGRGFVGRTVDVSKAFEGHELAEGEYTLQWKFGEAVSGKVSIYFIPDYIAIIETNRGNITIEFFPEDAPHHVESFLQLSRTGFYKGSKFHRVIRGFMMQGGAPADPSKALKETLDAELSKRRHVFGTVSMARTDDRNSATSQFFICFAKAAFLDGKYTVFGRVIDGEDVVKEIEKVETDHSPCKQCGQELPPKPTQHCGSHHKDAPKVDVFIKKIEIKVRGK